MHPLATFHSSQTESSKQNMARMHLPFFHPALRTSAHWGLCAFRKDLLSQASAMLLQRRVQVGRQLQVSPWRSAVEGLPQTVGVAWVLSSSAPVPPPPPAARAVACNASKCPLASKQVRYLQHISFSSPSAPDPCKTHRACGRLSDRKCSARWKGKSFKIRRQNLRSSHLRNDQGSVLVNLTTCSFTPVYNNFMLCCCGTFVGTLNWQEIVAIWGKASTARQKQLGSVDSRVHVAVLYGFGTRAGTVLVAAVVEVVAALDVVGARVVVVNVHFQYRMSPWVVPALVVVVVWVVVVAARLARALAGLDLIPLGMVLSVVASAAAGGTALTALALLPLLGDRSVSRLPSHDTQHMDGTPARRSSATGSTSPSQTTVQSPRLNTKSLA
mmetsp:Transcript_28762/g.61301  ORF Transcript_28762/g.61301 Transcript_28762/m.61301 type:complete len:385 (-) Transcript_28762:284-1438(-)